MIDELKQWEYDKGYDKGQIDIIEKIIDKIDDEERWLINIKTENGFISKADIRIAMCRIRQVIPEPKGSDK